MNELDFAASLSGEFRGMQDAGWSTTITANEVFDEISAHLQNETPRSKAELRVILMLYCQLAEAGGIYETLKNMMGDVTLKPYLLTTTQGGTERCTACESLGLSVASITLGFRCNNREATCGL